MRLFITFEGIDGSGKSTQARLLADRLRAQGCEVVLTREPGGSPGAEDIRRLLVEGEPGRWTPDTEILLFTAARLDHVQRTITPALEAGAIVISDRYFDSTRAYQGAETLRERVDQLHEMNVGLVPDLTLIFDLDPAIGFSRAGARDDTEDRFEKKGLGFQQELLERFRAIAAQEPDRCTLIDAEGDEDEVGARVWATVEGRLG